MSATKRFVRTCCFCAKNALELAGGDRNKRRRTGPLPTCSARLVRGATSCKNLGNAHTLVEILEEPSRRITSCLWDTIPGWKLLNQVRCDITCFGSLCVVPESFRQCDTAVDTCSWRLEVGLFCMFVIRRLHRPGSTAQVVSQLLSGLVGQDAAYNRTHRDLVPLFTIEEPLHRS